jgi:hypothetical protein
MRPKIAVWYTASNAKEVVANYTILDRSQNPACRRRLHRRRHWHQRHVSADHRLRMGIRNEYRFATRRSSRGGAGSAPVGIAAEIPLPPRRTPATTGVGVTPAPTPTPAMTPPPATPPASALRALAAGPAQDQPARAGAGIAAAAPASPPALREMPPSAAAVELPPDETVQPRGDIPNAVADPPPTSVGNRAPRVPVIGVTRPAQRSVATVQVVKKRVVRSEHHRGYSGAYAQYGGGWGSWGLGSPYHF